MSDVSSLLTVGVPKESSPGERRVALVPADVRTLKKSGFGIVVEAGAGMDAGYLDTQFADQGARIAGSRSELDSAAIIVHVRACAADSAQPNAVAEQLRE